MYIFCDAGLMPTLWSRLQILVSRRMCMPGTTSDRERGPQWSCLSSGWLPRVCRMGSSLTRLMWLACNSSSGVAWINCQGQCCTKYCSFTVLYSGLLGSPAGRSSVVVKVPTLEWILSPSSSYWRMDRDSVNQPTQHALKKCELVLSCVYQEAC